jgi:hypothetical protein
VDAGVSVSMGSARPRLVMAPRARGHIVPARPVAGYWDQPLLFIELEIMGLFWMPSRA